MKKGDCYEVSGRAIIDNPRVVLVHALVRGQGPLEGKMIGHAWLEIDDIVIDNSNGRSLIVRKEAYYDMAKPEKIRRYTQLEACRLMLRTRHFGPWERKANGKYKTVRELDADDTKA